MSSRHQPTVIVTRRARPGRDREFERWIRRLVARAADAPGAVDAELQPPNALHPGEWVVVYRFEDTRSLEAWMHSPTRTALIETGNELVDGAAREQVVALAPEREQVTAVSSVRVRPDSTAEFRALHGEVLSALANSPGFLRCDLFEPVQGVQEDTVVVLAFDSREHLDRWLRSDERRQILERMDEYTEGDRTINVVGGFAGWFPAPGGHQVKKWKTAVVVMMAIVPITLLYTAVRLLLFPDAHVLLSTVIGNLVGVAILTWLAMPFLTSWLQGWLQR